MQFGTEQTEALRETWGPSSLFYTSLGRPARDIVEVAYNLKDTTPPRKTICQDDLSLAFSIASINLGCEKSQFVHAFLTGKINALYEAVCKLRQERRHYVMHFDQFREQLIDAWVDSFRVIAMGRYEEEIGDYI